MGNHPVYCVKRLWKSFKADGVFALPAKRQQVGE